MEDAVGRDPAIGIFDEVVPDRPRACFVVTRPGAVGTIDSDESWREDHSSAASITDVKPIASPTIQPAMSWPTSTTPNSTAIPTIPGSRPFMNYTYQSFNFRNRQGARPFYDLVASIAAEEFGHIELVSATINTMLTGTAIADRSEARRRED